MGNNAPRRPKTHRIGTVDEYIFELGMLPANLNDSYRITPDNELEVFFFGTLEKHHGHQLDMIHDDDYDMGESF